jgi:hypothetical protein
MVSIIPIRALVICALALLVLPLANGQDHRPPNTRRTQKQQSDLIDFTLAGVNPANQDYGQCFTDARQLLIHETVDRAYFWSNLCSVTVAAFLFIVVVHQRQCQRRFEKVTTETVVQYHNALERAEAQIRQATSRNHALMHALSAPVASDISATPDDSVSQRRSPGRPPRDNAIPAATTLPQSKAAQKSQVAAVPQPVNTGGPQVTGSVQDIASKPVNSTNKNTVVPQDPAKTNHQDKPKSVDQMGLFGSDVELINRINVLQQQLSSSQEREKHLRRQLNDSELRLQKEQQKSRTLQA